MDNLTKAQKNLLNKDVSTDISSDTLYVVINDTSLELAQFEIDFQAKEYDENNTGAHIIPVPKENS